MEKIDIKSLSLPELEIEVGRLGEKSFRAKQLYHWLHKQLVTDFDDMTNLSKGFREFLKEQFTLTTLLAVEVKSFCSGLMTAMW